MIRGRVTRATLACSYYQGLKDFALSEVEGRSEARLNGNASWLEELAFGRMQPA